MTPELQRLRKRIYDLEVRTGMRKHYPDSPTGDMQRHMDSLERRARRRGVSIETMLTYPYRF